MSLRHYLMRAALGILAAFLLTFTAPGAPLEFVPLRLVQPDGFAFDCYASGDEYYNWLHDASGYTIMQDPRSGFYVYAQASHGNLLPTSLRAGKDNPRSAGLVPWALHEPARIEARRTEMFSVAPGPVVSAPSTGTLNNIVVFIRFADDPEFTDLNTTYATMCNGSAPGTNSLYNYFREASYNKISILSTFYPIPPALTAIAYQDTHARGYFQPYNQQTNPAGYEGGDNGTVRRDREQIMLKGAIEAVRSQIPSDLVVDSDADGYVDNVCFVVRGSPTGWSSLLWPHMWSLYSQTVTINGKRVWNYNLQLQSSIGPSVLCHEMFHTLGSPDLYHYKSHPVTPIGSWDLMANNTNPPQHMSAYMKWKYGKWIDGVSLLSAPGRYLLKPVSSPTGNIYRVNSPYSAKEYFILEYRKKNATFERGFPAEGLLVYRINTATTGNANGPPDEIYVYRPGGTLSVNGNLSQAPLSTEAGFTAINDLTDPATFLSTGAPGGLSISDVSTRGDTIAFTLGVPVPAVFDSLAAGTLPGDSVALVYRAAAQYRNQRFEILCSDRDSTGFVTIAGAGRAGDGTTAVPKTYAVSIKRGSYRFFRVRAVDSTSTQFSVSRVFSFPLPAAVTERGTPVAWEFPQNYPNPFNPTTTLQFSLPFSGPARLIVVDLLGRIVATMFDGRAIAGRQYAIEFRADGLPSGVYFATLTSGTQRETRKLIVMR